MLDLRPPQKLITSLVRRHTVASWRDEYETITRSRYIKPKTVSGRLNCARHIVAGIGNMHLDIVRSVHVATLAKKVYESGRHTAARRVLIEARDFFGEAMLAGFIHRNPAAAIKTPHI